MLTFIETLRKTVTISKCLDSTESVRMSLIRAVILQLCMKSDNWVGLNVSDIDRIQRISSTKYLSFFEATFFHKYLSHF